MSDRVLLLEADLRAALEAHERTGVTRSSANLAAFLHGYHTSAQRRRSHDRRDDRRWKVEVVEDRLASLREIADGLDRDGDPTAAGEVRAEADNLRAEAGLS